MNRSDFLIHSKCHGFPRPALPEQEPPSPEARLLALEALSEIDAMLDQLKPKIRAAFLLAQQEGLTCRQISIRMGVSVANRVRY